MAIVDRLYLSKALALVLPGVAKKALFNQANKLGIQNGRLISYNDEISISHPFEGFEEYDHAIDGVQLYELINRITTETITLALTPSGLMVRARDGKTTTRVTLKAEDFVLPLSEIDWSDNEQKLPKGFKENLRLVAELCATDMSRPRLTYVHIGGDVIEGGDGYRSARIFCDGLPKERVLLPAISAIKISDYDITHIAVGKLGEWVHFQTTDDITISSRLMPGVYPDLAAIHAFEGHEFTLPSELSSSLDRAKVFAYRVYDIDEEIHVSLRNDTIIIKAEHESGKFVETLKWDGSGINADFSLHPDFLKKALKSGAHCVLNDEKIKFVGEKWEHCIMLR